MKKFKHSLAVAALAFCSVSVITVPALASPQTFGEAFDLSDFLENGSKNAKNHEEEFNVFGYSTVTATIPTPPPAVDPEKLACEAKQPIVHYGSCPNRDKLQTSYYWSGGQCKTNTVKIGNGSGCK